MNQKQMNQAPLSQEQLNILNDMGITVWLPRALRDNTNGLSTDALSILNPQVLKRNLRCWVLLHEELRQDEELVKLFQGMIKVLNLPEQELCISFIPLNHRVMNKMDINKILDTITAFEPKSLLIMGKEFGQGLLNLMSEIRHLPYLVKLTYHPHELMIAPQHKKQAYQDLLRLKEMLAGDKLVE